MEVQGDEGTVRHRCKFVVLGTALPAASEARHSGHRLAPTGKGLPTRLPRSGLVQPGDKRFKYTAADHEDWNDMQEMIRRASQDAAQRTSENLELLKRLAETMASSVRETSSEMVEWAKQASKQQQEATRQIIQARSLDEVLDTQNRYVRENLQALLDFSAKILHRSADTASETSDQLQKKDQR